MRADFRHFADELAELKARLLTMGGLAEERLRLAMRALVDRDSRALEDVIAGDARINSLHLEIDDRCFTLIALHQPVAIDLRMIVSTLKINGDLERVGDLAVNVAEASQRYLTHPPVKPLIDLPRMGDLASKMLRDSLDAFVERNVTIAQSVLRQDDWLDAFKGQVFRELLTYMLSNHSTIEPGVDLILISRHLERVGDHATNIAEDVIFLVEARDVRHRGGPPPGIERRKDTGVLPL
ncbi:MAG TPA: phosphate signaling complex protein PhoU [Vicinamibacterales bacterium]